MSNLGRAVRQTLTIARRDFIATVATPTFLIFLLAPLLMIGFGAVGGVGAQSMADSAKSKMHIVAIVPPNEATAIRSADANLRKLYRKGGDDAVPKLEIYTPGTSAGDQARALFAAKEDEATAVLYGPLDAPHILFKAPSRRHAEYLARLAEDAMVARTVPNAASLSTADIQEYAPPATVTSATGRNRAAFLTVFGLFLTTFMLASQAVGTMAEERSNKVIEVLAASVPLETVFFGKLVGMFGVALVFLGFWGTLGAAAINMLPGGISAALSQIGPAVGGLTFLWLFVVYFTTAYMLLGAVFLSIGAQASSQREIQMLTLPITIFQFAMLALGIAAATHPESGVALFAYIFPFSSPFAMAARAANEAPLAPHLVAIGWQILWVAITITIGAWLFRRGVLKSAGPKMRLFRRRARG